MKFLDCLSLTLTGALAGLMIGYILQSISTSACEDRERSLRQMVRDEEQARIDVTNRTSEYIKAMDNAVKICIERCGR